MSDFEEFQQYPECERCLNRRLDPFQCETCEDACNFEEDAEDDFDSDDDSDDVIEMTYHDFMDFFKDAA